MMSKITCSISSDIYSAISDKGNVYDILIIPIEEQICLDSISAWNPVFSPEKINCEEESHDLQIQKTPSVNLSEKANDMVSMGNAKSSKRKINSDATNELYTPQCKIPRHERNSKSLSDMDYGHTSTNSNENYSCNKSPILRRSLSFPNIGKLSINEGNPTSSSAEDNFHTISSKWVKDFSEVQKTAAKEDSRLKSLVSASHAIAEEPNGNREPNTAITCVPNITNSEREKRPCVSNNTDSQHVKIQKGKRSSCVRKLDWGECVGSKSNDKSSSFRTPKRKKTECNKEADNDIFEIPASQPVVHHQTNAVHSNSSTSLPDIPVLHKRISTKHAARNQWTADYSLISMSSIPCAQPENKNNLEEPAGLSSKAPQADMDVVCIVDNQNKEADNSYHAACSEELFENDGLCSNPVSKQKNPGTDNCNHNTKSKSGTNVGDLSAIFNARSPIKPQGLTFTPLQIKKMCNILCQLYSEEDA